MSILYIEKERNGNYSLKDLEEHHTAGMYLHGCVYNDMVITTWCVILCTLYVLVY